MIRSQLFCNEGQAGQDGGDAKCEREAREAVKMKGKGNDCAMSGDRGSRSSKGCRTVTVGRE